MAAIPEFFFTILDSPFSFFGIVILEKLINQAVQEVVWLLSKPTELY